MKENFEEKFMEIQADLISLCLEVTENKVDKIFAYASIEDKSTMFNAFFQKSEKIMTINQLEIDKNTAMNFLRVGTGDLKRIIKLCEENATKVPTEIKMYYEVQTGRYKADYKYNEICSEKTGISSGEVFMKWYTEVRDNN